MRTTKPNVYVTREIPRAGLDLLCSEASVYVRREVLPPTKEELIESISGFNGLLCLLTDPVDADVIKSAGRTLKVISNYAVGVDNIDIVEATKLGIPVGNTPDVLTETTADLTFALLMSAARRIVESERYAREGKWRTWEPSLMLGADIYGATLGILGMGRIGRAVARRAVGFNMEVIYHDPLDVSGVESPGARSVSLSHLLSRSDFLSLHTPLNESTRHMIDEIAFREMKKSAILINTARGALVDHDSLALALATGNLAYAALDVTEPEPLPPDHPLFGLSNCIVVPHIGSASVRTRNLMAKIAATNVLDGLHGRRLANCVNQEVYT